MTDVLLINSIPSLSVISILNMPIGTGHLASCLEREGIDVKILDLATVYSSKKKVLKKILSSNPKIVGISSTSQALPETVEIAKSIKRAIDTTIVIGGPHVSGDPNFIQEFSNIFDYEVVGEGEISFTKLVKEILKGKNPKRRIVIGKSVKDISSLPFPAYHLMPMEKYRRFGFATMSSRGCPYNCIYCFTGRRKIRFKEPKLFVEEVKFLKEKYKNDNIAFCDENFTINKSHAEKICLEILKENMDLKLSIQTRCDLVDRHILELIKKAGCELIQFGIETFSERLQIKIKKYLTLNSILRAIKLAKEVGLKVGINILFGLPTEGKNDINKTVNFLYRLKPDYVAVAFPIPYPGTELFDIAIQNGLDREVWNKYARGEIYNHPIYLNNEIKKLFYFYYFNKLYLRFPSPASIGWLIANNIKLLFSNFSYLALNKLKPIHPFFRKFSQKFFMTSSVKFSTIGCAKFIEKKKQC